MNTNQLLKCIRSDSLLDAQCAGVYPLNKIPSPDGRPECVIANLDPHNKDGSHWIAIHVDQDGVGEFFDSYGRQPKKKEFIKYLNKNCCRWTSVGRALQSPFASTCGQYCVYYLFLKVRGVPTREIVDGFGGDFEKNDMKVTKWLNGKFDVNTDVFELEFMINQFCSALMSK